jgi:energy-coupling factor transport system permease protein
VLAFVGRGWTGPLIVLAVVGITAWRAGVARRMVPFVLATAPLIVSILLVNTFLYPGATDPIVRIGPLAPTWTGLEQALQAALRVIAFALSVAVLGLTTEIRMVPRLVERAAEIVEAQRARGLDTEGGVVARARGVVPLAGPLVLSALHDVEEQTMALEARAFSAPGRRTLLHALPDSDLQRALRWTLAVGSILLIALTVGGLLALP